MHIGILKGVHIIFLQMGFCFIKVFGRLFALFSCAYLTVTNWRYAVTFFLPDAADQVFLQFAVCPAELDGRNAC